MHAGSNPFKNWDDDPWDVFLADDDELDPQPEPGDFFIDDEDRQSDGGDPCYR